MKNYIDGYAFKPDEEQLMRERQKRYDELNKHDITIKNWEPHYAKAIYRGIINDPNLSDLDILILCDKGNTCFGGTVERFGTEFVVEVYTD